MRLRRENHHRARHTLFEWMGVAGLVAAVARFAADVRGHRLRHELMEIDEVPVSKLPKKARKKAKKAAKKAAKMQPLAH